MTELTEYINSLIARLNKKSAWVPRPFLQRTAGALQTLLIMVIQKDARIEALEERLSECEVWADDVDDSWRRAAEHWENRMAADE